MIPPRADEVALAGCLSLVGLCTVVLVLLRNPHTRLSRWVDRNVLPYGVSR